MVVAGFARRRNVAAINFKLPSTYWAEPLCLNGIKHESMPCCTAVLAAEVTLSNYRSLLVIELHFSSKAITGMLCAAWSCPAARATLRVSPEAGVQPVLPQPGSHAQALSVAFQLALVRYCASRKHIHLMGLCSSIGSLKIGLS